MYFLSQRQTTKGKRLLSLALLCGLGVATLTPAAQARLIFTTENDGVSSDQYTIDQDGTVATNENADLTLNFGAALDASIKYNDSTGEFTVNKDLNLGGNVLEDFKVESFATASAPTCTVAGEAGGMYYDTTVNQMFVCTGADGWDSVETMAAGAVTTAEILNETILAEDIATDAVDSAEIKADAVTASEIATGAVTTDEILDGTIATADVADSAVTTAKINNAAVTTDKLNDSAVTNAKIADDAVTIDKVGTAGSADKDKVLTTDATGTAQWEDRSNFGTSTLTSAQIFVGNASNVATGVAASGDVTLDNTGNFQLVADSVTSTEIADGAVTTTEILDGTIATADIADDAVTEAKIATDAVDSAEIKTDAVKADEIATGAVTTDEILDGTIATADIADDAVTEAKIATDAVDSAEIKTDAVKADEIATGAVTTDEILDGTIKQEDIEAREIALLVAPEFSNFTLEADGSDNVGTFESDHDSSAKKNFYKWSTRQTAATQDYDLVYQWQVPENFVGFSSTATAPLELDYKTDLTTNTDNTLSVVSVLDTAGTTVGAITGGSNLVSATADTWVEDQDISFATTGTFTPGEYVTIRFRLNSKATTKSDTNPVYLGPLKFNVLVK